MAGFAEELFSDEQVDESDAALTRLDKIIEKHSKDQDARTSRQYALLRGKEEAFHKWKIALAKSSANKEQLEKLKTQKSSINSQKAAIDKYNEEISRLTRRMASARSDEEVSYYREQLAEQNDLLDTALKAKKILEEQYQKDVIDFEAKLSDQAAKLEIQRHENLRKSNIAADRAEYWTAEKSLVEEKIQIAQEEFEQKRLITQAQADEEIAIETAAINKRIEEAQRSGESVEALELELANKIANIQKNRDEQLDKSAEEHYNNMASMSNELLQNKLALNQAEKTAEVEKFQAIMQESAALGDSIAQTQLDIDEFTKHPTFKGGLKVLQDFSISNLDDMNKLIEKQQETYDAARDALKATEATGRIDKAKENLKALQNDPNASEEDIAAALKELDDARAERDQKVAEANAAAMSLAMSKVSKAITESMNKAMDEAESIIKDYTGSVSSRLQGSDKTFNDILDKVTTTLSINPYIQSKEMLKSVKTLTDSGVAYNLEQRAFLGTISDKIASTFDAFDSNLARLIRLQQADTTAARLGMEAALTKFLNSKYQDSSYLTKGGIGDQVAAKLIDAQATMTRDEGAAFEFTVQKWLGSLSSVGLSDDAAGKIAEGLNYVATGNVQALAGSTELQTLIAMSAAEAGLEYSELLLNGLDSDTTNRLLSSMVSYLKRIAEGADNQVVRSAYGDIFSMSMSDFKAISNLSSSDISDIASTIMDYSSMISEVESQLSLSNLSQRSHMGEMLTNLYDNATFGVATDMMSNPVTYAMHKMLKFMDDNKIDINIPFISAFGSGVDINASVTQLMRMGLGVAQGFSLAGNILSGLSSGGGLSLDGWGASDYTKRGGSMGFSTGGSLGETTSSQQYVASGNSEDMKNSTMNTAADAAEEDKEITNKHSDPGYTIDDMYKAVVEGEEGDGLFRTKDRFIQLSYGDGFLHTRDSRLIFDSQGALLVTDTRVLAALGMLSTALGVTTQEVFENLVNYETSNGTQASMLKAVTEMDKIKLTDRSSQKINRTSYSLDSSSSGNYINSYAEGSSLASKSIMSLVDTIKSSTEDRKEVSAIRIALTEANTAAVVTTRISQLAADTINDKNPIPVTITDMGSLTSLLGDANGSFAKQTYQLLSGADKSKQAHVRIQNEDGKRLQVDTDFDFNYDNGVSIQSYDVLNEQPWHTSNNVKW